MPDQVFVAEQIGIAVLVKEDRVLMSDEQKNFVPCRLGDIGLLQDAGAKFRQVRKEESDLSTVLRNLEQSRLCYNVLFLVLSGANNELSLSTRQAAQAEADELLKSPLVLEFVTNRLKSKPAPSEAEFASLALGEPSSQFPRLTLLYAQVAAAQPTIAKVWTEWLAATEVVRAEPETIQEAEQALTEAGLFAAVVSHLTSNNKSGLNAAFVDFATRYRIAGSAAFTRHLLNEFRSRLAGLLHVTEGKRNLEKTARAMAVRKTPGRDDRSIGELIAAFGSDEVKFSKMSGREAKSRVDRQILSIRKMLFAGNVANAEKYLRELISFQLEHGEVEHVAKSLCALTAIALEANQLDFAEELVQNALRLAVEDKVIYNARAEVFKAKGQFAEAYRAYDVAVQKFEDRYSRSGRADVLNLLGRFQDALTQYEKITSAFPDNPVAFNGRVSVFLAMGDFRRALKEALANTSRFPSDSVSRTVLAETWKRVGNPEKAVAEYLILTKEREASAITFNGLAQAYRASGRADKALATYEKALSKFPDSATLLTGKASILRRIGRLDDATKAYKQALQVYPASAIARYGLATIDVIRGDYQSARTLISDESPRSELDWRCFHLLTMGLLRSGSIAEAESRLRRGIQDSPWQSSRQVFWTSLGYLQIRKRCFSEASDILQSRLHEVDQPRRQKRLLLLGHAQAELGNISRARLIIRSLEPLRDTELSNASRAIRTLYRLDSLAAPNLNPSGTPLMEALESAEFALALAA